MWEFTKKRSQKLFKLYMLLCIALLLLYSCAANNIKKKKDSSYFVVKTTEIILEPEFHSLIKESKKRFKQKFDKNSELVLIDFNLIDNVVIMSIENRMSMYIDEDERNFYNISFTGGTMLDDTPILISNNINSTIPNLYNFTSKIKKIKLRYGTFLIDCTQHYTIKDSIIKLSNEFCSSDM